RMYWYTFILESPATIFTMADGVKGKHNNKNNGPNPLLSNHAVKFCTFLFLCKKRNTRDSPYFRISKKTRSDPSEAPNQDNKNPQPKPNAFALAITKRNKGKNGRNASNKGNKIPGSGPNERYLSIKSITFSSVNHSLIE